MRLLVPLLALLLVLSRPASADILAALTAIEYKDFPRAIQELEPIAEKGDSQAEYLLGKLLLEGHGGAAAIERGIGFITKAAERDYGQAQALLGFIYANGIGIAADPAIAQKWLTRSLDRLGRGPSRRSAEATLAALKQKGLISDEAPAPPATPVPEVTQAPIAAVDEAPAQKPVPAEVSAREPELMAARPMEPAPEPIAETASVAETPPEPAILAASELPVMAMEGSIIGPASPSTQETSDLAHEAAQGLGVAEEASAKEYTQDAIVPAYEPGRRKPLADDLRQPAEQAVITAEQGPAPAPAEQLAEQSADQGIEPEIALAPVEGVSIEARQIAALPGPMLAPVVEAPEPTPEPQPEPVTEPAPDLAEEPEPAAEPAPDLAEEQEPATEDVGALDEIPASEIEEQPIAAEGEIHTASAPDILPLLAPAEPATPEPEPVIASAPSATDSAEEVAQEQPIQEPDIRIQLAAVADRAFAESEWKRILKRNPDLLAERQPIYRTIDLGEQGVFHRIQTGPFASLGEARALCAKLIEVGQDCLVMGK